MFIIAEKKNEGKGSYEFKETVRIAAFLEIESKKSEISRVSVKELKNCNRNVI